MKRLLLALFLPFLLSNGDISHEMKPTVKVVRTKPQNCNGKGASFDKLFISSKIKDEKIEVWLFTQKYDSHWMKKVYRLEKSGIIDSRLSSCDFTGNYMAVAFYNEQGSAHDINLAEVPILHNSRGNKPKFRVTKRKKINEERGGGVYFEEGEVFTPKGESVEITLFMEKKDGGWRKKHFNFIGSGSLKLSLGGKDLTGRYKSHITIKKTYNSTH